MFDKLVYRAIDGSLDTKRGNTVAGFAETMLTFLDYVNNGVTNDMNLPLNIFNRNQAIVMHTMGFRKTYLSMQQLSKIYLALHKLIPYYEYYFSFYKANKRLVVLELLSKIRFYNHNLF